MAVGVRKPGEFCWINILTTEPEKAKSFFARVLGWTYTDMSGIGFAIKVQGKDIGGLFDLANPQTPAGTPPVIGVLIKVENADATVAKIKALGGKANAPFDVMENGRLAVCFDPNGAQFDIWESKKAKMTEVDSNWHGAPTWSETITSDVAKARTFYEGLFGWTSETMPMPEFDYTIFSLGSEKIAGAMKLMPHMGNIPPHWETYFAVDDVDVAAKTAKDTGGTLHVQPTDIPGVGRFAMIESPQGVYFSVIKYLPMA